MTSSASIVSPNQLRALYMDVKGKKLGASAASAGRRLDLAAKRRWKLARHKVSGPGQNESASKRDDGWASRIPPSLRDGLSGDDPPATMWLANFPLSLPGLVGALSLLRWTPDRSPQSRRESSSPGNRRADKRGFGGQASTQIASLAGEIGEDRLRHVLGQCESQTIRNAAE